MVYGVNDICILTESVSVEEQYLQVYEKIVYFVWM